MTRKKTETRGRGRRFDPHDCRGSGKLKPVVPGGCLSFGAQTFPADGNCGIIVTTRDRAKELSADPKMEIQIVSYGFARVKPMFMPAAPIPAAEMALANAGIKICRHEGNQDP